MQKITIDIVSDVVCPWCYIGKRRVERAMKELDGEFQFEVNYLPFELNPQMPAEGRNQKEYLTEKFGGDERYQKLTDNVTQIAKGEGLIFNYDKQLKSPNTRNAHRLIWFAKTVGKQTAMKEALMKAYFEQGLDLTQNSTLIEIATSVGVDPKRVEALLSSDEGLVEVQYLEQMNHQRGISGVPFYIVNGKYGISGAQPSETFINAFRDISVKTQVE
ncbi:MAG: DsbA family oxidoreductase [Cyclobacteriaceae bacterium]|nr:DsbA family oxidoreductase [Cyclobacteriaceae bacterium]